MMPVMNGHEVLLQLKDHEHTQAIPFFFLSANVEKKDVAAGLAMGAKGYISKPFETENLFKEIKRWL
jgi:CheY-like chemotaxis protein